MRYIPHTADEIRRMLELVGAGSVDELFRSIPAEVQHKCVMDLPHPLSELEALGLVEELGRSNYDPSRVVSFLGGGAYDHFIPSAVGHLISRSEFYTSYTPYQAEVSQGTLQAIYEYQTLICRLTGMDLANASGYDGGSVCADAALMACAIARERKTILVSETVNPAYRKVVETYTGGSGLRVVTVPFVDGATDFDALESLLAEKQACVILQQPNFLGVVENLDHVAEKVHGAGALLVVSADPIALALLRPPAELGADIAVGEGQALGVPLSYGGPYLGYFATRDQYKRQVPGRIAGCTEDSQGRTGYVLTLQTREQHIRREKATSNICTNQALCALAATVYLSLIGKSGLREVAGLCLQKSHYLAGRISGLKGFSLSFPERPFFKEFAVDTPRPPGEIIGSLLERNMLAGIDLGALQPSLKGKMLVAVTERRTRAEMDRLVEMLAEF